MPSSSSRAPSGSSLTIRSWIAALTVAGMVPSSTERGRVRWDAFRLRVPVLGKVVRLLAISRFARTLSTLLAGGIPIVRAMGISRLVASNAAGVVYGARQLLTTGGNVTDFLSTTPPGISNVVGIARGHDHLVVLRNDGSALAWGANAGGQTNVPASATNLVQLAAGNAFTAAANGEVDAADAVADMKAELDGLQ